MYSAWAFNLLFAFRIAFITYETAEEALRVFKTSENLKINGKEVTVMYARAKKKKYKNQEYDDVSSSKKSKVSRDSSFYITPQSFLSHAVCYKLTLPQGKISS